MKKILRIVLFCVITMLCLTVACFATEFTTSDLEDFPDFSNDYGSRCDYDSITFVYDGVTINLQLLVLNDFSYHNAFIYCSNIEKFVEFVINEVQPLNDPVDFSFEIIATIALYNIRAEDLGSDWFTYSYAFKLYDDGLSYLGSLSSSYDDGFDEGYRNGYGEGFTQGTYNGMNETETLKTGLLTIFSSPLYVLGGILDFEIFGINLFNLISTLLTILLFAFVIKHLLL